MVTAFRPDEVSSEILMKNFLKELLTDPAVSPLVALHLAKKDFEDRWRIVAQISQVANVKGSFWDEGIKKITNGGK